MKAAGRNLVLVVAFASALAGPARPQAQVCSNVVPLAVMPGPGVAFQTGCAYEYILKPGGGSGSQGAYAAVMLPPCDQGACAGMNSSGANTFDCLAENGYGCCVDGDACLPSLTGNWGGPLQAAIQARFDRDNDKRVGICYEQYAGNGARVMTVPITGPFNGGCYAVQQFVSLFIKRIPGNGTQNFITAEFVATGVTAAHPSTWGSVKLLYDH